MTYCEAKFKELIGAGVPKEFIRTGIINNLLYFKNIYVYYGWGNAPTQGWHALPAVGITSCKRDIDNYGEVKNNGFPTWEEYSLLSDSYEEYTKHKSEMMAELEMYKDADYS